MIGHVIGNYKIEQKLGEGGMGTVYRGVDMMIEREVAIKALRAELASQPQVVERFRSEAVTLAKLNHPNVATLYSFFRQGDAFFMVMEFVRGASLDEVIRQRGAIPCAQAVPLFCQVLDGIDHAHDFGIIHRDIKPANMMLTQKGTLKVLDFGIARILGTSRMTRAGHLIGTIEYMSPEQVRGQETDARSDIYSLGMLLYEMLTGRVPFDSQNEFELMKAQTETMPTPPRQLNPDIPPVVEEAIMRAIAKEPGHRFQTAGDFRAVLQSAGFNANARLDPLLPGGPRSDTQPLGTSPHSVPPSGQSSPGYSTSAPDSQPNYSTVPFAAPPSSSGEVNASARAFTDSASGGGATAPPPQDQLKETRIGTASGLSGGAGHAGAGDHLKETRLGVAGAQAHAAAGQFAPQQQQNAQQQSAPAQSSFFSRLTWVHYAGAGLAVVAVFGVLIAFGAVLLFSGGSKTPAPETPAASQTNQAVSPPPPAVTQQEQPPVAPPTAGPPQQAAPAAGQSIPTAIPTQQPVAVTPAQPAAPAPRQAATRPAPKPKGDPAAEAARRRREAALRALDQ